MCDIEKDSKEINFVKKSLTELFEEYVDEHRAETFQEYNSL